MKRIGIMGCGTVADYGHVPAIRATPGLSPHALYDPDGGNLTRLAGISPMTSSAPAG